MVRINLLEDSIINKIAAGEVVERPCSVVKELVENSLDARADHIYIDLKNGGLGSIRVRDDGMGIAKEDAPLAPLRHATSKIKGVDDLFTVGSMGFRGEALASIGAVSNMTITSFEREAQGGFRMHNEGESWQLEDWQGAFGTQVLVENLFYNVPARLKFLKSPAREASQCKDWLKALALANPEVTFQLSEDGKPDWIIPQTKKSGGGGDKGFFIGEASLRERLSHLWSSENGDSFIYGASESDYCRVEGLFSPPGYERGSASMLYSFVNKRWVKDQNLRYGILRGYQSHLLKGKYPACVLFITCDPSLVDVNVHPAKIEVRFQYASEIQGQVAAMIRQALRQGSWAMPTIESVQEQENKPGSSLSNHSESVGLRSVIQAKAPTLCFAPQTKTVLPKPRSIVPDNDMYATEQIAVMDTSKRQIPWGELSFIGSVFQCYLLFEYERLFLLIDQHAFHERIIFERLSKDLSLLEEVSQLLVPEVLLFSEAEILILKDLAPKLLRLKIKYRVISAQEIELLAVPNLLAECDFQTFFREIVMKETDFLPESVGDLTLAQPVLATLACHSAVRAGVNLTDTDWRRLLAEAQGVDFYLNCPHGRRVFRWYTKKEVESWFDR